MALSFSSSQHHHFDSSSSSSSSFIFPDDDYYGGVEFWPPISYCETEFLLPAELQLTESFPLQDFSIPEDNVFQFDGPIPPVPEFIHEPTFPIAPLPVFQPPAGEFSVGTEKQSSSPGELSAQSIAARKRRRRISEKKQELGKLIPGGNKMNTAEMFQSAAKYVKFLQAQLGVLQLAASLQEPIEVPEEMEKVVASPAAQKKLYSEGKCLVPTELLHALAIDELLAEEEG